MKIALGIDIGDGESCVAFLTEVSSVEPQPIPLAGGTSFLSAVSLAENGQILIGENAIVSNSAKDKHIRFKSHFRDQQHHAREAMLQFVKGIMLELDAALKEKKLPPLASGDYTVVVGCPAGWNPDTRADYTRLLKQAGLLDPIVVSESRGALMYGIKSSDFGLSSQALTQSTLVVDLGSSTLDYAWINKTSDTAVSGDARLGGGLFDEYLLESAVQQAEDPAALARTLNDFPDSRAELLLAARRAKETYFTHEDLYAHDGFESPQTIYANGRQRVTLRLNGQDMWTKLANKPLKELSNNSFVTCLRNSLSEVARQTKDTPPKYLLLTGGASRMAFFQDECSAMFPGAKLMISKDPEFTIAKGLAYCAFEDASARACADELLAYIDGPAVENIVRAHLPTFHQKLADELMPLVIDGAVKPAFQSWHAGDITSINDMTDRIEQATEDLLNTREVRQIVNDSTKSWIRPLTAQVDAEVNAIAAKHKIKCTSVLTIGDTFDGVTGGGLGGPTIDVGFIPTVIGVVVTIVLAVLGGGSGVALFAAGPIGWIIGIVIGAGALWLGKDAAEDLIKRSNIPRLVRLPFSESLVLSAKNRFEMKSRLVQALANSEMTPKLTDAISKNIDDAIGKMVSTELAVG